MQTDDLLAKLKDIYLPERVSQWWPLAYGWWIVIACIIIAIFIGLIILYIRKRRNAYKDSIVKDFRDNVEAVYQNKPKEVLQSISVYLKRVAVQKFPKENIKTLYADKWIEFLDSKLKEDSFSLTKARLLEDSYKPLDLDKATFDEIMAVAEKWLRRVI